MKPSSVRKMSGTAIVILIVATLARVLVKFLPAIRGFLHVK